MSTEIQFTIHHGRGYFYQTTEASSCRLSGIQIQGLLNHIEAKGHVVMAIVFSLWVVNDDGTKAWDSSYTSLDAALEAQLELIRNRC